MIAVASVSRDSSSESTRQVIKPGLRAVVITGIAALALSVGWPAYSSTIGDPGRFASYNRQGLPSNRLMRGLGDPDRIERREDGTSIFWYRWIVERRDGHIAARGMAAFSFAKNSRLNGFEILTMDEKGKYVDSTLDSILSLAK